MSSSVVASVVRSGRVVVRTVVDAVPQKVGLPRPHVVHVRAEDDVFPLQLRIASLEHAHDVRRGLVANEVPRGGNRDQHGRDVVVLHIPIRALAQLQQVEPDRAQ